MRVQSEKVHSFSHGALAECRPRRSSGAAAVLGLTVGSEVDVIAYLAARHFGLKNFGALYGALVMALSLGTSFGPLAAGAVFDRYASYARFLMLAMALMAVSAAALVSLGPTPTAVTPAVRDLEPSG